MSSSNSIEKVNLRVALLRIFQHETINVLNPPNIYDSALDVFIFGNVVTLMLTTQISSNGLPSGKKPSHW